MRRFISLTLLTCTLLGPARALACVILPSPQLTGYPGDGAEDVPLDVIPVYTTSAGPQQQLLPWFSLPPGDPTIVSEVSLESERGPVAVTVRGASVAFLEFVPAEALAPDTLYTLSVAWTDRLGKTVGDSLKFTTGSAFADEPSAPPVSIANYTAGYYTDCDPGPESSCLSLPDDEMVMVELVGNEHPLLALGSFFLRRPLPEMLPYECLRIRRRAANGVLGAATVICVDDGPLVDFGGEENGLQRFSCDQEGLKSNGSVASEGATIKVGDESTSAAPETEEDVAPAEARTASLACNARPTAHSPDVALWLLSMAGARGLARAWRRRGASDPRRAS